MSTSTLVHAPPQPSAQPDTRRSGRPAALRPVGARFPVSGTRRPPTPPHSRRNRCGCSPKDAARAAPSPTDQAYRAAPASAVTPAPAPPAARRRPVPQPDRTRRPTARPPKVKENAVRKATGT